MRSASRPLALLVSLSLLAAACAGSPGTAEPGIVDTGAEVSTSTTLAAVTTTTVGSTTTTTVSAPLVRYDQPGPYPVGRRTVSVVDDTRDGRIIPIEIWYPAIDDGTAAASEYVLIPSLAYTSEVALDAPPIAAVPEGSAGFPLVLYSHGNNGWGWVHADLTQQLASYGFVVVAPDHVGNTLLDSLLGSVAEPESIRVDRPLDVSATLSAVLDGSGISQLDEVGAVVDAERVGIVGHSLGGLTALLSVAGSDEVDADGRIDAIVAMAPATTLLDDALLGRVDVPTLLLTGTSDTTTPIATNTERPFDLISGRPLYRVDLVDAGHMTFSDICLFVDLLNEIEGVSGAILALADSYAVEACVPELLDIDTAQDAINHTVTAFLLAELADDATAALTLTAEASAELIGDSAIFTSAD